MINNIKHITIATDISCSPRYRIATWACYIRTPNSTITHKQRFIHYSSHCQLLETMALANALRLLNEHMTAAEISECKIIVYNEIYHVVTPIMTKTGKNVRQKDGGRVEIINNHILPLLKSAKEYEVRKIKAHVNYHKIPNNTKYFLNHWCDHACHDLLRVLVGVQRSKPFDENEV